MGEYAALKARVPSDLDVLRVAEHLPELGVVVAPGKINELHIAVVYRVGEQKEREARVVYVSVGAAVRDGYRGPGLHITVQIGH